MKKGFVFRAGLELKLLLLKNETFEFGQIDDKDHLYDDLPLTKADVVEVIGNNPVILKSLHSVSFATGEDFEAASRCTAEEAITFALDNNPTTLLKCL